MESTAGDQREKLGCSLLPSPCFGAGGVSSDLESSPAVAPLPQDGSSCPGPSPLQAPALTPYPTYLPLSEDGRVAPLWVPASPVASPDPANTSAGCGFIKISPFELLSWFLFPTGISVIPGVSTKSCHFTFRTNRLEKFVLRGAAVV